MVNSTHSGKVKFVNEAKGWGFIVDNDKTEVFFHVSNTLDKVVQGDNVAFDIEIGKRGPKAVMVKRVKE